MQGQRQEFLARAWRGEERLWKVWWLLGLPLGVLAAMLGVAITEEYVAGDSAFVLASTVVLFLAYIAWCGMAWRCAPNVDKKTWTPIARVIIVLGLLRATPHFLKMFQHSSQSP
jgi:hypothetical protein